MIGNDGLNDTASSSSVAAAAAGGVVDIVKDNIFDRRRRMSDANTTNSSEAVETTIKDTVGEVVETIKDTAGNVIETVEGTVDIVKERTTMTVITFLDEIKTNGIIGKVLKLAKDKAGDVIDNQSLLDDNNNNNSDDDDDDDDDEEERRIVKLVTTLRRLVKTLVTRISDDDAQRLLLQIGGGGGAAAAADLISSSSLLNETVVTKDGIKYTVLNLVDDGVDSVGLDYGEDGIIFRGYNLTQLFNTNITLTVDVSNLSTTVTERLRNVSQRITDVFTALYASLENVQSKTQAAQSSLDSILPYYYVAVSFIFVTMGLTIIFIIGVILAWVEKQPRLFRNMNDWIICPIFIVSTLLMWIFTIVFLILGLVGGDFCVNSPDVQVTKMMEQVLSGVSRIGFSKCTQMICVPILFLYMFEETKRRMPNHTFFLHQTDFGYYYVNGCPAEFEPKLMEIAFKVITNAWNGLEQFGGILRSIGKGPLTVACGATADSDDNAIEALSQLSSSIVEHFSYAARAVFGLAEIILCRSFSPLYTSLSHNILCTDFINLVTPMLWCMFVISICSMIMITLRVAWHEFVPAEGKITEEGISEHEEDHKKSFVDDVIEEGENIDEDEDMMRAAPLETQSMERDAQANSGACLSVSSLMRGNVMSNDVIDVEEEENSSQVGTSDDEMA